MRAEKSPADGAGQSCDENYSQFNTGSCSTPADAAEADTIQLISTNRREWAHWLDGYQWGLIHGAAQQRQDDQAIADLAARLAIARLELQAKAKEVARLAIQFIDIEAARKAAGSSYVPWEGVA